MAREVKLGLPGSTTRRADHPPWKRTPIKGQPGCTRERPREQTWIEQCGLDPEPVRSGRRPNSATLRPLDRQPGPGPTRHVSVQIEDLIEAMDVQCQTRKPCTRPMLAVDDNRLVRRPLDR